MGDGIDLSSYHLGTTGIAAFALKRDAERFAVSRGWRRKDVTRAYNRFNIFWVVYQNIGTEGGRLLTRDGWMDLGATA